MAEPLQTYTEYRSCSSLYEGHAVDDISRSDAGATNLILLQMKLVKLLLTQENKEKAICFVTGVPGQKNSRWLNIATDVSEAIGW